MKNFNKVSFQYSIAITLLVCLSDGASYFIREKKLLRSTNRISEANKKKYNDTKNALSSFSFLSSTFQLHTSTRKKSFLDLMEFLKDVWDVPMSEKNKKLSKDVECAINLKKEDGHNWSCKIKYKQGKKLINENSYRIKNNLVPFLCICSYEYDCSNQNETFFFSYNYMEKLAAENKKNRINRGPEYQCENVLMKKTRDKWSCVVKKNVNNTIVNEEYYCDCKSIKKCTHQRMVDFY